MDSTSIAVPAAAVCVASLSIAGVLTNLDANPYVITVTSLFVAALSVGIVLVITRLLR